MSGGGGVVVEPDDGVEVDVEVDVGVVPVCTQATCEKMLKAAMDILRGFDFSTLIFENLSVRYRISLIF
jgi:hypothetical protein